MLLSISLGAALIAPLADHFGRKKLMIFSILLYLGLCLYSSYSVEVLDAAFWLIGSGICFGTFYVIALVYITEIVTDTGACMFCLLFHLVVPLSWVYNKCFFYFVSDWSKAMLYKLLLPGFFLLCIPLAIDSPKFLIAKREYTEAKANINFLAFFNRGRELSLDFEKEDFGLVGEYGDIEKRRSQELYQFSYYFGYASSRQHFFSFSSLIFCSCFSFSLFSGTSKIGFMDLCLSIPLILIVAFIMQYVKQTRTIFACLFFSVSLGIISIYNDTVSLFLYPIALLFCICSLTFAVDVCPCRVRATGFGLVFGVGELGFILGMSISKQEVSEIIIWITVFLLGLIALKYIKSNEYTYEFSDIFEICEKKRRCYGSLPSPFFKNNTLSPKPVRKVSALECSDIENMEAINDGKEIIPEEYIDYIMIQIEGERIVNGIQLPLGFDCLCISIEGQILFQSKDEIGDFIIQGEIEGKKIFIFTKKYKGGSSETKFRGEKQGQYLIGKWEENGESGNFSISLKIPEWSGTFSIDDNTKDVYWLIGNFEGKVLGLGDDFSLSAILYGNLENDGRLTLFMSDSTNSIKYEFVGFMNEFEVEAEYSGSPKMVIQLRRKLISIIERSFSDN